MTTNAQRSARSAFEASALQHLLRHAPQGAVGTPFTQLRATLPVGPDRVTDPSALAAAVRAATQRHEILRTTLVTMPDGGTAQDVHEDSEAVFVTVELDGANLDELCARERDAIDVEAGPGFRATLVTAQGAPHTLVLTAHAAIADRTSLRLLLNELDELRPPADHEPLQYADFAAWHHDLLGSPDGAADRQAWARQLRALSPGGAPDDEPFATVTQAFDAAALDAFATAHGIPVPRLLVGAFAIVGWRFAGERDVLLVLNDPARHLDAIGGAVGPFEREVPLPGPVDGGQPALEFLRQFDRSATEWTERVEYLDPALVAPLGHALAFRYDDLGDGVELTSHRDDATRLSCTRRGDTVELTLAHTRSVAEAMLDSVGVLVRHLLDHPDTTLAELPITTPDQRERLRAAGEGPVTELPGRPVHELIAAQPAGVVAATADGHDLTYGELDARANRLARRLIERGVGRGDRVVVSLPRSFELLVAILGTLKAGAAFVPVDPAHPVERLRFVLADTAAPILLGSERHRELGLPDTCTVLEIDDGQDQPPAVEVSDQDLAYVLYTSGSTGAPNGVLVPHRALVNYLTWAAGEYRLQEGSGALTHSSISFDFTLTTLFAPLLVGQRTILLRDGGVADLAASLRTRRDLSLLKLTPTHLEALGQLLSPREIDGAVRTVVVGGEALRADSLALFRAAGARVVNEYGPTETVVGSTAYVVTGDAPATGPVPIGRPIANTRVQLLGSRGEPVPDGAVGQLFIGGLGVSDGYLNQPALTAERFVAGLYRTGDLARRLPDGNLMYLGRIDDQVKIQGVRVEPGEIEAVLRACEGVAQAVAVVRRDEDPGQSSPLAAVPMLVAYVVPEPGQSLDPVALVQRCRDRLPEQLVPKAVTLLEALPLTINGKLDRAALPKPDVSVRSGVDYAAPTTEVEEILAGSIATVLGVDSVGIDDNYFLLGGDSIRSVMVASRAQARGVEVTVADLHAHPTVRRCAAHLAQKHEDVVAPVTAPFSLISAEDRAKVPADVEDAFPLNLLQEGMIFHRDFAAKSAVYHAIASLRLKAPFNEDVMRVVIHQLVERHPMLRTSFDMTTFSHPMQLIHSEFANPLSIEDLRDLDDEERERRVRQWIADEKARGFELDEFPLIRFRAQRLSDEEWQFTYGFHHEIVDGWSEALMIAELFSQYFSIIYDEPISIKAPTSTMRDAVALELEALQDKRNVEFWEGYLADATVMRLPRFGGGPKVDKGARDIVRIEVPVSVELSDKVKRLAQANAVPLKNVLMAAHLAVMSTYGGHADTLTYTVGNGRPETADGSTAIGLFVNSLALRVPTPGGTWRELIAAGLGSERASMPYRRLPMAELKRHQGSEPLAETLFFFTNYHVFGVLDQWVRRGVSHVATDLYGESTFPFCAINRLNRETGHLEIRLEYDGLQFSTRLMESVRDCYAQVLEAMTADPDGRYDTRSFASSVDLAALAETCFAPDVEADDRCLHELIEAQAKQRPDAIALQYGDNAVSYRQLDRRADRLAAELCAAGVGPEAVVGVLAERSIEQIVALVAVLKAGGAYLPLDPSQPDERLAAIVADARTRIVVADPRLAGRLPADVSAVDPRTSLDRQPERRPRVDPRNAAYVIYTSGSTGQPKGVVVEHRNVVHSTLARLRGYPGSVERYLLLSSFAFDSSVAGIFWTLAGGGTLVLPPEGAQREPATLARLITAQRPTHTLAIPSLLRLLLDEASAGLDSLRVVISAGEACPTDLSTAYLERLPGCTFHNEYGPTEGTVWATEWSSARDQYEGEILQVPIGRPVAGTHVVPLNHTGQLVPIGVTGELHIGGAGVARGYLGRPAETAASFRPDRFGEGGARSYATGDLARTLPEHLLEFQGRADHQVKVQGFRVELGAIEALLDAHPALQRSIVVSRGDQERAIVAYVVPNPGQEVRPVDVQRYVRERLPKYMIPAAVVVMDKMPLTATGKVDRGSLPAVTHAELAGAQYVAPRNDIEEALAAIWCKVLEIDRVGVHDTFFDIGGESLRAMQAISATNKVFQIGLSVRRLFDAPTVGDLAVLVREELAARAE